MRSYRVWMTIRGSIVKPPYDGYVDVVAEDEEHAFSRAVAEARRTAHWDSPLEAFRLVKVEPR